MNRLLSSLREWNIELSDIQLNQFEKFYELLVSWNEKMNLTSIIEKNEVIDKHFVDSVALLHFYDLSDKYIIDVGTGGGFPGIPLKIICPECNILLVDSLAKRVNFLNTVIDELGLKGITALHGRAEDLAHDKAYREKFDIATSRAVANLSTLSEYCLPFVKVGGSFIPYKSGNIDDEIVNAHKALSVLGGRVNLIEKFTPPETDFERSLVFVNKIKVTSKQYPRKAGTPSKSPL